MSPDSRTTRVHVLSPEAEAVRLHVTLEPMDAKGRPHLPGGSPEGDLTAWVTELSCPGQPGTRGRHGLRREEQVGMGMRRSCAWL